MHSTYFFLLDTDDPQASDQDVLADAVSTFEYLYSESYGDENNWSHPEFALRRDGRLLMSPEHTHDDLGLAQLPECRRWPALVSHALRALAAEFLLFDADWTRKYPNPEGKQIAKLSDAALIRAIQKIVPARLAQAYGKAQQTKDTLERYRRATMAREYEIFQSCALRPFSRHYATPYEGYPCFDLRAEADQQANEHAVILLMDIHT
ncbi:MAG: hypothetical protein NTY53_03675 [Kiritimatiellaeota bacterium]|nr:hypothetical protein [Kiritimatiellota bacterium]